MEFFYYISNMFQTLSNNLIVLFLIIALSSALQQFFPPYPGDTVMILCGVFAAEYNNLALFAFLSYFLTTVISSFAVIKIGEKYGRKIFNNKLIVNHIPSEKVDILFNQSIINTGLALFVSKFIAGMNSVALILAGIKKKDNNFNMIFVLLAAYIQNVIMFTIGNKIGDNYDYIRRVLSKGNMFIIIFTVIIIALIIIILKKRRSKRQ